MDWSKIEISGVTTPGAERWLGLSIQEAAETAAQAPLDFCCELLVEDGLRTKVVEHIGNEDNVQTIMRHAAQMPSSDGILAGERPHPRGWGTFPRWLGHYVRELGVLTWEDAIRKMTSLPAQRLGLHDRGLVRPGMAADLVCLDPAAIQETSSFEEPRSYPTGVHHVVVNGVVVVRDGESTGQTPGTLLPAYGRKGDGR